MNLENQKDLAQQLQQQHQQSLFLNREQHGKVAPSQEKAGQALGPLGPCVEDILWEATLGQQCMLSESFSRDVKPSRRPQATGLLQWIKAYHGKQKEVTGNEQGKAHSTYLPLPSNPSACCKGQG